jgi:Glycosyltransferase family 87
VDRILGKLWVPVVLVALSAWIAFRNTGLGDYPVDAAPAVTALSHGHFGTYLSATAAMGPFATLLQAPFSALGGDELSRYQWACLPCLLVVSALGLYLGRIARDRGASTLGQVLIPVLCLVNPLTLEALAYGHPEELLTGALAVGAVAVATRGLDLQAGILLGFAIASKQWAVLAVFPVLMVLPARAVRTAIVAGAVAFALALPGILASPSSFFFVQTQLAQTTGRASIWSGWYPLTHTVLVHLDGGLTGIAQRTPPWVQPIMHPVIGLSFLLVPLAVWARRRRFKLTASEAMALLTLLALLRCVLDPVNNVYYHLPLLLALIGWDAVSGERLPLRGLTGVALALLFWEWSENLGDLHAFNLAYLTVVATAGVATAWFLFARTDGSRRPVLRTAAAAGGT